MRNFKSFLVQSVAIIGLTLSVASCDLARNYTKIDREANAEFQDFRDAMAPRPAEDDPFASSAVASSDVPDFMPYVEDLDTNMQSMPLVSVSVNQTIPLRDVLFELADQADIDIQLDPRIRGSIIFTAREKPFDVVIERIARIAGLRYDFEDGVLNMELDTPYHKTYKIDYLNIIRNVDSSIETDVSVASGAIGDSSGESGENGSQHAVTTESLSDFWAELEGNINQILAIPERTESLLTENDPVVSVEPSTDIPPVSAADLGTEPVYDADGNLVEPAQPAPPRATPARINITQGEGSDRNADTNDDGALTSYSVNRQAGIISVIANDKKHALIKDYLAQLQKAVSSQVLIEAKILEVQLTDEFSTGIDWSIVLGGESNFGLTALAPALNPTTNNAFTATVEEGALDSAISALARFGTVRALASPRLTVLNNQSAVLNVAENQVFFELDVETITQDSVQTTTVDSEIRSVPEGVLINVQPSINLDTRQISMAVRPSITRIDSFVDDPAVAYLNVTGVSSQIPVVSVQEVDSIVSMDSGEVMIMGGLLQDRTTSQQEGVPVLSEIPFLGTAFRNQGDKIEKTELVILIKAQILEGRGGYHKTDKELYERFSGDRRPFSLR